MAHVDETFSTLIEAPVGTSFYIAGLLSVGVEGNGTVDYFNSAHLGISTTTPGVNLIADSGTSYPVAAVPEPSAFAMLLAGLGLFGLRRRASQA